MRLVFGLVLVVGLALAGGAVMMAKNYISKYQYALAQANAHKVVNIETVDVIVASRALKYGERLTQDAVRVVQWPQASVPEGTYSSLEAVFPPEFKGDPRIVLRPVEANEALLAVKVTKPGEDAGITSRLKRGMRAFAIKVDVSSGVSGFLRPGDQVDVYWSGNLGDADERRRGEITRLIQTNIELIAIDQIAGGEINGATIARTVTVSVSPTQVAALAQAQSTGRLSLSLVGAGDDTVASFVEVDQRALLGLGERVAAPEREVERVCTIRTRRGADVVEIPIPCTN
ncbi:Flp pilus assembly protein CpaB [Sedimentitalea sp. CY04]|uniref:Flp pilus assembly protein CpaB n=1 Tax=Parasedimentitalea denitrificans TaxID=2211118 RepID=A0ABX0W768_9RHOB|nr:Flp pilus assembly protein CpaB [Sedimentitalea sp. CY04]NIZ61439.1 Flp pilus assembly protein CpaB [Sedimentitalea sp. CY04]